MAINLKSTVVEHEDICKNAADKLKQTPKHVSEIVEEYKTSMVDLISENKKKGYEQIEVHTPLVGIRVTKEEETVVDGNKIPSSFGADLALPFDLFEAINNDTLVIKSKENESVKDPESEKAKKSA